MWPTGLPARLCQAHLAPSGPTQPCVDPAKRLPISLSISAGFVTLYTLLFGFFGVFQKETFWEMLTPFSEPREIIWPGPGEPGRIVLLGQESSQTFSVKGHIVNI